MRDPGRGTPGSAGGQRRRGSSRRAVTGLAALLASTLLAACGTGAGGGGETAQRQDAAVSDDTPVTLNIVSAEGGATTRLKAYEEINAAFTKRHPNVTIKQTEKSFSDLLTTIKLQLSDESPIDVVQTNQGYYTMGALVKAKLLRPLDPYVEKHGWAERQPASLLAMTRMSEDGTHLGQGNLYGIAATGDAVGVYYNKRKLEQLGLERPRTFAEFERALAAAKAAGETPIKFGNLDKWPGVNEWQTLLNAQMPSEQVRSLIFGTGGDFTSQPVSSSVARMQEWVKKGYFEKDVNGISYDDAWKGFAKGDGLFLISGTWLNSDLEKEMGDRAGFFLAPGADEGTTATTASGGFPWGIPSKSKYPDVAASYIDFVTGPEAARIFLSHGDVPALAPGDEGAKAGGLTADAIGAWRTLKEQDQFIPYVDWATPTMNETMTGAIQQAMALKVSPQEFTRTLQQDYAKFTQKR